MAAYSGEVKGEGPTRIMGTSSSIEGVLEMELWLMYVGVSIDRCLS